MHKRINTETAMRFKDYDHLHCDIGIWKKVTFLFPIFYEVSYLSFFPRKVP